MVDNFISYSHFYFEDDIDDPYCVQPAGINYIILNFEVDPRKQQNLLKIPPLYGIIRLLLALYPGTPGGEGGISDYNNCTLRDLQRKLAKGFVQHPDSQAELEATGTAVGLTIGTSWQAKDILFIQRYNVVPFFFL